MNMNSTSRVCCSHLFLQLHKYKKGLNINTKLLLLSKAEENKVSATRHHQIALELDLRRGAACWNLSDSGKFLL